MKQIITISKYTPAGEYEGISKAAKVAGKASTPRTDRVGDNVIQQWDTNDFNQNPVLYWNHQAGAPVNTVLGHVTRLEVSDDALLYEAEFATTPLAVEVQTLIAEGHFTGNPGEAFSSVRFQSAAADIDETQTGYKFKKNKLMEISIVSMPANLDAMITSRSAEYPTLSKCIACTPEPAITAPVEPSTDEKPTDEPSANPEAASAHYRCLKALLDAFSIYLKHRGGQ